MGFKERILEEGFFGLGNKTEYHPGYGPDDNGDYLVTSPETDIKKIVKNVKRNQEELDKTLNNISKAADGEGSLDPQDALDFIKHHIDSNHNKISIVHHVTGQTGESVDDSVIEAMIRNTALTHHYNTLKDNYNTDPMHYSTELGDIFQKAYEDHFTNQENPDSFSMTDWTQHKIKMHPEKGS